MTVNKTHQARLLFLISNDFGELASALSFLSGTSLQATLLLPERLYSVNRDDLPVSAAAYRNSEEILHAVDSWKPGIVFLFSGYLYAINRLLELDQVGRLIDELRVRKCRLVTSDPFLGILDKLDAATINDAHPHKQQLSSHFLQVNSLLRDIPHLYPFCTETPAKPNSFRCFNDGILNLSPQAAYKDARHTSDDPRWLFVLSSEDYVRQCNKFGRRSFLGLLVDIFARAAALERMPVLIAPQQCLDALGVLLADSNTVTLLSYCGYQRFMSLLMEAGYVFWWNLFSQSIAVRLMNRLPGFFFDKGHFVDVVRPIYDLGLRCYFAGAAPELLDVHDSLTLHGLAQRAANQEKALEKARSLIYQAPIPQQIVARLLDR